MVAYRFYSPHNCVIHRYYLELLWFPLMCLLSLINKFVMSHSFTSSKLTGRLFPWSLEWDDTIWCLVNSRSKKSTHRSKVEPARAFIQVCPPIQILLRHCHMWDPLCFILKYCDTADFGYKGPLGTGSISLCIQMSFNWRKLRTFWTNRPKKSSLISESPLYPNVPYNWGKLRTFWPNGPENRPW